MDTPKPADGAEFQKLRRFPNDPIRKPRNSIESALPDRKMLEQTLHFWGDVN